jgi:pilus assembly protein CpaB
VSRRSRTAALLGLSAVCAGLAMSLVNGYANNVRAQVGPLVSVVVATKELSRGKLVTPPVALGQLSQRQVPVRFVSPDSLRSTQDALGLRTLVRIPAGSYVGDSQLGPPDDRSSAPIESGRAARLVEVPVSGATTTAQVLRPGTRVDVLITSERGTGAPRTYLALQRVQLVSLRPLQAESGGDSAPDSVAALRVTLRQAVLLTAAQNFARELRLVPRPAGDDRVFPPTAVVASDLHP